MGQMKMQQTLTPGISPWAAKIAGSSRENIHTILKIRKISLRELARELGVKQSVLWAWEKGLCEPKTYDALQLYAEAKVLHGEAKVSHGELFLF